jgi:ABC-type sugar transport system substrate-binding protein
MRRRCTTRAERAAAIFASVALALSACGTDDGEDTSPAASNGSNGGDSQTIAINMYSQALPYFQDIVNGATEAAEEDGWSVEVTFGQTDPQLQFNQIQNAVTNSPAGMIVAPVDQEALIPAFQAAKDAGVQVVTVADDVAERGQDSILAFVGIEYEELGRKKAQWIVDELGGQGKVAVIHGIRGLHFTEAQFTGAKEVFDENSGIELIDGPYAGEFSADAGLRAAENVLTSHPDIDALYFDNDDIALGGILAAKARNIPMDQIVIIGTDGGEPARDAVKAGDLDYTISLCGYATGAIAVGVIQDKVNGDTDPDERIVPIPVLDYTADTAEENDRKIDNKEC